MFINPPATSDRSVTSLCMQPVPRRSQFLAIFTTHRSLRVALSHRGDVERRRPFACEFTGHTCPRDSRAAGRCLPSLDGTDRFMLDFRISRVAYRLPRNCSPRAARPTRNHPATPLVGDPSCHRHTAFWLRCRVVWLYATINIVIDAR